MTTLDAGPQDLFHRLTSVLNEACAENGSNTPDFILAEYLLDCLTAFNKASTHREAWYGKALCINPEDSPLLPHAAGDDGA